MIFLIPLIYSCAESDVLPLPTVHVYSPLSLPLTFRVWMYRGKVLFNRVIFCMVTTPKSAVVLVQVTVVAGPPVEIQVRVN